jgi:hypothetical protein
MLLVMKAIEQLHRDRLCPRHRATYQLSHAKRYTKQIVWKQKIGAFCRERFCQGIDGYKTIWIHAGHDPEGEGQLLSK